MAKYAVCGGKKLKGKVKLSGNKNSILPCLAAGLLSDQEITLRNVPKIADVGISLEILKHLGASVTHEGDIVRVKNGTFKKPILPQELANKLRASILFIGPMLARFGKVEFFHPGGDVIGKRSIDAHLQGFNKLGFEFKNMDCYYKGWQSRRIGSSAKIFLEEASVTATENLVLASVLGKCAVTIQNCAEEPHVVDLCNLLMQMGANIEGIGTSTIKIQGVERLGSADFTIRSDHIEFGTYAIAAAMTGGEIDIENQNLPDLEPIIYPLEKMGLQFKNNSDYISVFTRKLIASPRLQINLWPGFPTDMMSVAVVLATQANGLTLCHDWMYESRMFFVDKLISMGAKITIADPHRVLVSGPTRLYGRNLETPDIRAGIALVLAAMIAEGKSLIDRAELIDRGYENIAEKFSQLGADIQRID